ncbi:MAG: hypothetical protein EOP06_31620 [Proteobacteria bacterium]|nr:MAG: hypothetical protein EOP06_31620 [Pseudomonadota bacterium]
MAYNFDSYRNGRVTNYSAPNAQLIGAPTGAVSGQNVHRQGFLISCVGADATVSRVGASVPQYTLYSGDSGTYVPFCGNVDFTVTCTGVVTVVEYD